jgi:drug/metabolite transporter (DMT)-like permease
VARDPGASSILAAVPADDTRATDVGLVVVASIAFATAGPLGKVAASVSPVTVACARTGIAAVVLALVAPRALASGLGALSAKRRAAVALAGALLAGHFALFLAGLDATSLAAAVALVSLEPMAVVLAAFVALGIRPTRRELAGLATATLGAVVVASGAGAGEHTVSGDLMVLGAVALYGAYVAAARGLRDALPAVPYAAAVYGASSLLLLPFALALGLGGHAVTHAVAVDAVAPRPIAGPALPSSSALAAIVGLGLVPTLIGHTVMQLAARRARPALVALVCPGETIGAIAIGTLFMNAAPTAREVAGAALILAGATLTVTARATSAVA